MIPVSYSDRSEVH